MTQPVSPVVALCVLLAVTSVTVQSGSLRVLTARGERKITIPQLTLSIDYEAAQEPQVSWFTDNAAEQYQAQTTFANGKGSSTLTLNQTRYYVTLAVGDLKGQYFEVFFLPEALGNFTQPLNILQRDIKPGHDLGYTSGHDLAVTLTTTKAKGQNIKEYSVSPPYGLWVSPGSNQVERGGYPRIPGMTMTKTTSAEKLKMQLTFNSKNPVNGFLTTRDYISFNRNFEIVPSIADVAVLKFHNKSIKGPFPDTFLSVKMMNSKSEKISVIGCAPGFTPDHDCELKCETIGNDIKSFEIRKTSSSGYQPDTKVRQLYAYGLEATARLDMSQDFAGVYRCQAKMANNVTKVQEVKVVRTNKRARVLAVTKTPLNNSDIVVKCTATGDVPLQVFFSWGSSSHTPINAVDSSVIDLPPVTQSGAGPKFIAKVTLRPPVKESIMFCVAKNLGSSYFKWFHPS